MWSTLRLTSLGFSRRRRSLQQLLAIGQQKAGREIVYRALSIGSAILLTLCRYKSGVIDFGLLEYRLAPSPSPSNVSSPGDSGAWGGLWSRESGA